MTNSFERVGCFAVSKGTQDWIGRYSFCLSPCGSQSTGLDQEMTEQQGGGPFALMDAHFCRGLHRGIHIDLAVGEEFSRGLAARTAQDRKFLLETKPGLCQKLYKGLQIQGCLPRSWGVEYMGSSFETTRSL